MVTTDIYPPAHPERFLTDRPFAKMRMRQAQAWVDRDPRGYEPQDPRALMVELLTFVRTCMEASER